MPAPTPTPDNENEKIPRVSDEFCASIKDFTADLSITFPEYASKWIFTTHNDFQTLFEYCLVIYPERFFDILNQNEDIFRADSEVNVDFLPGVDFKMLYHCKGISSTTRETMWKYLQVILLNLVNSMKDKMGFGDHTTDLFSQLNEGDLQKKLKETMSKITDFFENMEKSDDDKPNVSMPKMEDLHKNIQKMFDGKIGRLAKEFAEDMSADLAASLGDSMEGVESTSDVLSRLLKHPDKMMGVVKSVKDKLSEKMTSGDISKEELMQEASEMMKGMGNLGGMADMMKGMMSQGQGSGGMADMMKGMMGQGTMNHKQTDTNHKKTTTIERLKAKAKAKQETELVKRLEEEAAKINRQREYDAYMQANPQVLEELCDEDEKDTKTKVSASKKRRIKKKAKANAQIQSQS